MKRPPTAAAALCRLAGVQIIEGSEHLFRALDFPLVGHVAQ